uniref:Uncharacterized protein n=1 Tax=Avena sativa TaxID=4498 RepID=A0ACD5XAB0_AVESA
MGVLTNSTSGINSPRSQLIRIETLVLIGIVVLFLLLVLGSYRRHCSHGAIKLIVWSAYTVSYTLVSYTIGLMQSYQYSGSSLFAVWAVCLLLILGNVDSLSAYSLNDNDNWKRIYIQQLVQFFWVGWIVGQYGERSFYPALWIIYTIAVFTTSTLTVSFRVASKYYNLADNTKWVANYMRYEHEHENSLVPNPISMQGYQYVVTGETDGQMYSPPPDYLSRFIPNDPNLVTVEHIWNCKANLLRAEYPESSRLKDICLSMALSKMINRRFAGFHLAESKLEKTREFVFQGLLSGDDDDRYERAFRVIEVELGFVHDFFYTKYYVLFASHRNRSDAVILPALSIPFCLWLVSLLFDRFQKQQDKQTVRRNYDALLTMVIVLGIAVLQLLQLYFYIASDWFKVYIISKYVARPAWQHNVNIEKSISFVLSWMKSSHYWENKLGQYSLLDTFNYTRKITNALCRRTSGLIEETKIGRKKKTISLTSETKKAVIDSLVQSSGQLTNGATSLRANRAEQLMWACTGLPTVTHSILIWHIATTLCEHIVSGGRNGDQQLPEDVRTHSSVASSLSKYCAYLVVFAPSLLPDHRCDTETIFDALVAEAGVLLEGTVSMQQRYETLMSWNDPQDKRLIVMGARLGRQLIEGITDPSLRWKILSEFWSEMMLYVAPSSDATSHLETLTRGGEFITHLWALLTHAGILDREDSFGTATYV